MIYILLLLWCVFGWLYFNKCYNYQKSNGPFPFRTKEKKFLFYLVIGPAAWVDIVVNDKDPEGDL